MSHDIITIQAIRRYTEDEAVMLWLNERGYCAVKQEVMSAMGGADYQRKAGEGPISLYDPVKNSYEMHPELMAKLRREKV